MKFKVITIDNKGNGFKDAVEETKKVADIQGLNDKQSLQLQLCTEELLSMARSITGEVEATFWLDNDGDKYDLNMSTETVMDAEKRALLISSSSSRKNEAATSFLGMLRDIVEQAMLSESDKEIYNLPDDVAADIVGRYIEDPEWDKYEQSILRELADDIKIYIQGGEVMMTVTKAIA